VVPFERVNFGGFVVGGSEQRAIETVRLLELGSEKIGGFGRFVGEI